MQNLSNVFKSAIYFFEELEKNYDIKYIVVGGFLTPVYAEARQTLDIDFAIAISLNDNSRNILQEEFKKHGFEAVTTWDDVFFKWTESKFIQVFAPSSIVKIDISIIDPKIKKISKSIKYKQLENRERIKIFDISCWATSKEDFILWKLKYKGYQDYKDALACYIRYKNEIDIDYIEKTAKQMQLLKSWNYVKNEERVENVYKD